MKEKHNMKKLEKIKANRIKELFEIICDSIFGNADFQALIHDQFYSLKMYWNQNINSKVSFEEDDILLTEEIQLLRSLYEIITEKRKLLKADRIQWIYLITTNSNLLEGLCVSFNGSDKELVTICKELGCNRLYESIIIKNTYQNKRGRYKLLKAYVKSTINFYGVLSVKDLIKIINEYEKDSDSSIDGKKRLKNSGNTLFYSAYLLDDFLLSFLITHSKWDINLSTDGLLIHHCFDNEPDQEKYKELYQKASKYSLFLPAFKNELFKYENNTIVYEDIGVQLLNVLKSNYYKNIKKMCIKKDMEIETYLEYFLFSIYRSASDHNGRFVRNNYQDFINSVLDLMKDMDLKPSSKSQILSYARKIYSKTRLWIYHGFSDAELESYEQFEKGFLFTKNINVSQIDMVAQKIYPNDLCPCKSGKKYKKCCGRKS